MTISSENIGPSLETSLVLALPSAVISRGKVLPRLVMKVLTVEISSDVTRKPPHHVLVVDDEMLIRWSIRETLAQAGWEVSEAGNAKEALRRLLAEPTPDVILLDYRLPDSSDLTLLEKIRDLAPRTAVVMMTAYGTPAVQSDALALGAHRVVNKPIEIRDLLSLVEAAYDGRLQ